MDIYLGMLGTYCAGKFHVKVTPVKPDTGRVERRVLAVQVRTCGSANYAQWRDVNRSRRPGGQTLGC